MTHASSLVVSGLSAGYSGRPVIRSLSLAPIGSGSVTALVGPNAAGKSTLLRALAGLVPSVGSIVLGQTDLNGLTASQRALHVGYMPQTLPKNAELTVLEGVIGAIKATPWADRPAGRNAEEHAVETLERLGILELAMEGIGRLSGGQRQLASLAQAIVRAPALLLLDEPTSALDLRHRLDVMTVIRSLADEGQIVIMVLHDLTLAARWADDLIMLHHGAAVAHGAPELALSPATLASVYGVAARIERCSRGSLSVLVDGPALSQGSPA